MIVPCACPDSFGVALLYYINTDEHLRKSKAISGITYCSFLLNPFRVLIHFRIWFPGFHPGLFKLNPFWVRNISRKTH